MDYGSITRLETVGPNELTSNRQSTLKLFPAYFLGPIPSMIEIGQNRAFDSEGTFKTAVQTW